MRQLVDRAVSASLLFLLRFTRFRLGLGVAYHEVAARQGDPRTELVPAVQADLFGRQIMFLNRHCDLVSAGSLVQSVQQRQRGRRIPLAVTFDDDLPSHARDALPSLQAAGAPGTFFVCGASLDEPFAFWWERLQKAYDSGHATAVLGPAAARTSDIHSMGRWFEGLAPALRDEISDKLRVVNGGDAPDAGLRWSDLDRLRAAGMEVGFHTRRHDVLPALDDESLAAAMVAGRAEPESLVGKLRTFAYPHGEFDDRVSAAVREAGYEFGFTTQPIAFMAHDDPFKIGRVVAPEASVGALAREIAVALVRRIGRRVRRGV